MFGPCEVKIPLVPDVASGSSVGNMTIRVLDTRQAIAAVLNADEHHRSDKLRQMLTPMREMFRYFPGEVDLAEMHAMSFGFPLNRRAKDIQNALSLLQASNAWNRIEHALSEALRVQKEATPDISIPDITFLLVLGDPDDSYFMGPARGFSGNGSATGYISLTLWPTEENLARLEAAAVHELNHNLRYAPGGVVWDPKSVKVGEQIISEGLADAFSRQLYGTIGYTPIGLPHLTDETVFRKVVSGLDTQGMQNFTAWVHGDEAAKRFGCEPMGLPTGAGYAVGNRLVDAYLASTRMSAAEALHSTSDDIIRAALNMN